MTVPYSIQPTLRRRGDYCECTPLPKPTYASECVDDTAYTAACSCYGVEPTTITKPVVTSTIWSTVTAYQTTEDVSTSIAGTETSTGVETLTTFTTITENAEVTETKTISTVESTLTTTTEVVTATATADPVPPTCKGKGFAYYVNLPDTPINGWGLGWINIIGSASTSGIFFRLFSGGASSMTVDADGNLANWWGGDLKMVVKTGAAPYKIQFTSVQSNVAYSYATTSASCSLGAGPDYSMECKIGTTSYNIAICRDPVYYDYYFWLYTDESELSSLGATCYTSATSTIVKARCVN
ncbi:hypothetical protein ABW19_dt0203052 [Dactylella cylindrospora]|nr:hypothetical protein ABW19_dt0203052 [Dactylella cylindrospora]